MTDPSSPSSSATEDRSAPAVYADRIAALRRDEAGLQRRHLQLGYLRLALGVAVVWLLLPPRSYVLLPLLGFALASRVHERVLRKLASTRRIIAHYQHATARLEDRWSGLRPRSTRLDTSKSLYAADLDLFGAGSLFELLCEARTSPGEDTLASWLLTPAPVAEILDRQTAVGELGPQLALREAFAGARGPAVAIVDTEAISSWGEAAVRQLSPALRWIAPLLVLLTALAAWRFAAVHSPLLLILALAINLTVTTLCQRTSKLLFAELEPVQRSLHAFAGLLREIEAMSFKAEKLKALQADLRASEHSASRSLAELASLATWAEARSNYVVRILDIPTLYSVQLALAVQRWRARHGSHLRQWLKVLGEFEALLSLAAYHYEHPRDCFPQLLSPDRPAFEAKDLGHPLLPESKCVRNDLSLGSDTSLLVISGSNMSGKSTLLRAVGINAVLAFAGAPVCAAALSLSRVTLAASIQVNDSLQAGQSRFYAEILRLRAITVAAHTQAPVLFLLDELLAGTNSADRLAGARGLVRELLSAGAVGLLSTHDLALAALDAGETHAIRNAHFEDEITDGQLRFDYRLRAGTVERSNGVALMRLIGLDV